MADIHILETVNGKLRLVFHVDTPVTNNQAAVTWSTAIVRSSAPATILPDGDGTNGTISAAEKAQVAAGTRMEIVEFFGLGDDFDGAAAGVKNARLQAFRTDKATEEVAKMQARLRYFGLTR